MLFEFECRACGQRKDHWLTSEQLNSRILCECGKKMFRLPGGHGLLYFEEGRGRQRDWADKPITSHAQHQRLMKLNGLVETGDIVPPSIQKAGAKHPLMKEKAAGTQRGRWY